MRRQAQADLIRYEGLTASFQAPMWECDTCGERMCTGADMAVTVAVMQALKARESTSDEDIDYSDIPDTSDQDWSGAVRGKFYRPIKQ